MILRQFPAKSPEGEFAVTKKRFAVGTQSLGTGKNYPAIPSRGTQCVLT
jgi:hypothetical protein